LLVGVLYKRLRRSCSSDFVARVRASSHQTPQAPFGGWVLVGLGSLKVGRGTGIGRGTGSASSRGTGGGRGAGGGACFRVVAGQTVEVTAEPRCKCSSLVVSRLLSLVVSVQRFMFQCVCRLLSVFSYFIAQVSAMGVCCLSATSSLKYQRCRRSCPCFSDFVANCILLQETEDWLAERFGRLELVAEHSVSVLSNGLALVQGELDQIRIARDELNV
jgi:hypothetical protein